MDYQKAKSLAFQLNSEDRHRLFVELLQEYDTEAEICVEWCHVCDEKRVGYGGYMNCDFIGECERWICSRCIDYDAMTDVDGGYLCPHHMNPTLKSMAFMAMKYQ